MIRFFEQFILYALIFLIPLETRKILYSWSPGQFNEYLNAYLYVTDLLIVFLIALWLVRCLRDENSRGYPKDTREVWMRRGVVIAAACVFAAGTLSLAGAVNRGLGIYQLFKLGEFLFLFFYFFANAKILYYRVFTRLFVASGIIQSLWAALQFFMQSDMGLKIFQESPIQSDLPYVANFFVGADKFIRAYGGFPHPNVLAAFLLFSIFSLYFLFLDQGRTNGGKRIVRRRAAEQALFAIGFFILLLGLILTFSRIALIVYLGGSTMFFGTLVLLKISRVRYGNAIRSLIVIASVSTAFLFIMFFPYLNARFHVNPREEAVVNRVRYSEESAHQIQRSPMFGVGVGNFIPTFKMSAEGEAEEFYQPVHNAYLLVASEMGIIGLCFFILLIGLVLFESGKIFMRQKISPDIMLPLACYGVLFFSFLILGLFDHFFWTLQQGRLMFWILAGVLAGSGMRSLAGEQIKKGL